MVPHGTRTHDGNRHYSESEWNSSGRTRVYEAGRCAAGRRTWFLGHRLGTADVILCSSSMRTSCSPTRSAVIEMMQIAPSNKRPTKDLRVCAKRRFDANARASSDVSCQETSWHAGRKSLAVESCGRRKHGRRGQQTRLRLSVLLDRRE